MPGSLPKQLHCFLFLPTWHSLNNWTSSARPQISWEPLAAASILFSAFCSQNPVFQLRSTSSFQKSPCLFYFKRNCLFFNSVLLKEIYIGCAYWYSLKQYLLLLVLDRSCELSIYLTFWNWYFGARPQNLEINFEFNQKLWNKQNI